MEAVERKEDSQKGQVKVCGTCGSDFVFQDDKCKTCFVKSVWLTNTDIDHLGIVLFFRKMIPSAFKNFKYGFPHFHREILWEAIREENEWNLTNRKVAIAAPRGSSKTTLLSKGFALYCALFGLKKYIVIASKTSRAAEKNLRWIRQRLGSSVIISVFGDLRPDSRGKKLDVDEIEGIWTKNIIVLKNGVTLESVGMGQQLRSSAEGEDVNRIDLFLADDTESDENTGTPERREDNEEWLFDVVYPSLDIDAGTLIFINTMTHSESILAKLIKPSSGWRSLFYQLDWLGSDGRKKYLWEQKFDNKTIEAIRSDYESFGRIRSFYKEFYNTISSEQGFSDRWINKYSGRVFNNQENWIEFTTPLERETQVKPVYMSLGIDLAFSESERSDYCVLLPLGQIHDGRKFVFPYSRGRYTNHTEIDEYGNIVRLGIIEEAIRLHEMYRFSVVVIDATGTQKGTFRMIKSALQDLAFPPRVVPFQATGGRDAKSKMVRLKDALQPVYESGRMYHQEGMNELRMELIGFGDTTDDILDALYNANLHSKTPDDAKYNPLFGREEETALIYQSREKQQLKHNWITL